jgi:hypothetical protein
MQQPALIGNDNGVNIARYKAIVFETGLDNISNLRTGFSAVTAAPGYDPILSVGLSVQNSKFCEIIFYTALASKFEITGSTKPLLSAELVAWGRSWSSSPNTGIVADGNLLLLSCLPKYDKVSLSYTPNIIDLSTLDMIYYNDAGASNTTYPFIGGSANQMLLTIIPIIRFYGTN